MRKYGYWERKRNNDYREIDNWISLRISFEYNSTKLIVNNISISPTPQYLYFPKKTHRLCQPLVIFSSNSPMNVGKTYFHRKNKVLVGKRDGKSMIFPFIEKVLFVFFV